MGLSTFPDTDLDRARDFVGRYGEDLRYCEELERWLVWDGTRWALGHTKDHLEVFRRAKRHAKGLEDRALAASDAGDRKDALSEAKRAQSAARIRATIDLAKSEPRVSLTSTNDLDRNPWLLNTIIGTIDLRTGKLLEHDREHLITQRIPFPYREAETTLRLVPEGGLTPRWEGGHACPTWFMFLEQAMGGKERLVSFLQRVVGYTLTGGGVRRPGSWSTDHLTRARPPSLRPCDCSWPTSPEG
jgi:putative DNA primase/helicase